jgi:hypothetical protein
MTLAGEAKQIDGSDVSPKQAAKKLFETVLSSDLSGQADDWELKLYRTPEGLVRSRDVQAWYRNHPDARPTDVSGESFVPTSWNPQHHIERHESDA